MCLLALTRTRHQIGHTFSTVSGAPDARVSRLSGCSCTSPRLSCLIRTLTSCGTEASEVTPSCTASGNYAARLSTPASVGAASVPQLGSLMEWNTVLRRRFTPSAIVTNLPSVSGASPNLSAA
ncbi:hypothetical protein NUW54_g5836 [Trametes sanguinea]|uniref:Uncharacterized protein n=1 Tax=Trametes sanguinea TaxID=158606 RepID=A0ACC1PTZ3_9APHY|nr:hypothetical protein NUW54_g5836 [Trametes sanguinea]